MISIYTDGSFSEERDLAGWGYAIVKDDTQISCAYGTCNHYGARQIAGEVMAVTEGMIEAGCTGIDKIEIVHDYIGVYEWVREDNPWNAKSHVSREYVKEFNKLAVHFDQIIFRHVKSHSGDKWNDKADELASLALGVSVMPTP